MTPGAGKSNGWDGVAEHFLRARNPRIGVETVRAWSRDLPAGAAILDLGCGHGVPISQTLIEGGFDVHGVDASPKLIAEFRRRFPGVPAECATAEESPFFDRSFDAVIAWGLLFLLQPQNQAAVLRKAAAALKPGGRLLFTAPAEETAWTDSLTGRESISLGRERYAQLLAESGMTLTGEASDEGQNHYYFASRL